LLTSSPWHARRIFTWERVIDIDVLSFALLHETIWLVAHKDDNGKATNDSVASDLSSSTAILIPSFPWFGEYQRFVGARDFGLSVWKAIGILICPRARVRALAHSRISVFLCPLELKRRDEPYSIIEPKIPDAAPDSVSSNALESRAFSVLCAGYESCTSDASEGDTEEIPETGADLVSPGCPKTDLSS
jgi:hypothetical protein